MSAETMKSEFGRAKRSSLLMLAGLVASLAVFSAVPVLAAGGDNDSPYNMPDRGGDGSSSESNGGGGPWESGAVVVEVAAGAEFVDERLSDSTAHADLVNFGPVTRVDEGGDGTLLSGHKSVIHIPEDRWLSVEIIGNLGSLQGPEFLIRTPDSLSLQPSLVPGRKLAFLAVGEPSSESDRLAQIDYVVGLPVEDGGIDLTALAGRLVGHPELDGKAAMVVLLNSTGGSAGQPGRLSIEALAGFSIVEAPTIRIRIPKL